MRSGDKERQSYLDGEAYRVLDWLLTACDEELKDDACWQLVDDEPNRERYRERARALKQQDDAGDEAAGELLCAAVNEEAEPRFLSHVCQLFYQPSAWDCIPATPVEQSKLLAERGNEVRALCAAALERVWAERKANFEKAMHNLTVDGHVETRVDESGEKQIRLKKPN
jgi:hypothetical protein